MITAGRKVLKVRECDRPRSSRSFGEGPGEEGLTELRARPLGSNPPCNLHPSIQDSFPFNGEILQGCKKVVLRVEQGIKGAGLVCLLVFKRQVLVLDLYLHH